MKIAVLIARVLLGLIFVVFGLNFFLHFIPSPPPTNDAAGAFSGGLYGSGGLALRVNRYTAFFLLVLLPISLNIFLFHALLAPAGIAMGAGIIALNVFLCVAYFKFYKSVFTLAPTL
jgi:putative oxidoreductase